MTVGHNRKGRAVFADKSYKKDDIIEAAPCIFIPYSEIRNDETLLFYVYDAGDRYAAPTGNGMLYNHSDDPTMTYELEHKLMVFRAACRIAKGDELTIDYENGPYLLPKAKARFARGF